MTDLALRAQRLLQSPLEALTSVPFWLALGLLFAPTLLSLFTRRWITIVATALLNFACLVLGTGQAPEIAGPVMIVTFAASLIVALFGLHENQLWQRVSGLDAKVTQVEEQMMTFLRALEGRSDMIDQRGEQARMAFEAARKALEDARKPPQPPKAAFPLSTQSAHTNTSGGAPQGSPAPPTPKA
jgi:uncharacterized membrane protein YccC